VWRVGIDVGGTFTDLYAVDSDSGSARTGKVLTTPKDRVLGVISAISEAGLSPEDIDLLVHGTTTGTNALIERSFPPAAMITTEGFRDVLEIGRMHREHLYRPYQTKPEPLIRRRNRFVLEERVNALGVVEIPVDPVELEPIIDMLMKREIQSVAVCLINSYANPANEQAVAELLRKALPDISITMSSDVKPVFREHTRFSTTAVRAVLLPVMATYFERLEIALREKGFNGRLMVLKSNGGMMSVEQARTRVEELVESGPAGGIGYASRISRMTGQTKIIHTDVGGTSFDTSVVEDGQGLITREYEIEFDIPVAVPMLDIRSVGAGGGSIGWIDEGGSLRVGPMSAGSEPGPACYGRGGAKPAVTDADLVLGKLDADNFAGGSIRLETGNSETALSQAIGQELDMDAATAAFGLAEVVDENMANAARVHAVENGEDLSDYTMIAFGGAAPLHAGRLCEKLGVERLLVPPGAGVGSAIGFLRAPFSFEANRSVYMKLSDFNAGRIKTLLAELRDEATGFVRNCDAGAEILSEYKVYMRYSGQGWEIPIVLDETDALNPDAARFEALFEADYAKLFGRTVEGLDIEITVWSVNATTPPEAVARTAEQSPGAAADVALTRRMFDPALAEYCEADVVLRAQMAPGQTAQGPAAITEDETTIILPASRRAICQPDGCIDITVKG